MTEASHRVDMMIGRRVPPRRATAAKARPKRATPVREAAPVSSKKALPRIEMVDLEDFNESINFLVYGDSGVGKTPFAGMAPNSVILSTEKGAISAKRFGSKSKLIKAPTWQHVEAALDFVDELQKTNKRRDWMVLDSTTKMQLLMLRWILDKEVEENDARDLDIPAIQNHQKWQNMFKRFIDRIIDMDINVIFIATAMHKEDPEGEDLVMPDIIGKDYAIAQYLCAQMDAVYCLKVRTDKKTDEPVWRLLTKARPPYFAKDRYDAHKSVVVAPYMPEIIEAILASAEYNTASESARSSAIVVKSDDDWDDDDSDDSEEEEEGTEEPEESEDTEEEEEEPEPAPKPARRRAATRAQAKPPRARRAQPKAAEEEPEEEEEAPAPKRRTRKASVGVTAKEYDDPIDEEEDDGEDGRETANRAVTKRQSRAQKLADQRAARAAAKRPASKAKAAKVFPEDDNLFDPDDTDEDISFEEE